MEIKPFPLIILSLLSTQSKSFRILVKKTFCSGCHRLFPLQLAVGVSFTSWGCCLSVS